MHEFASGGVEAHDKSAKREKSTIFILPTVEQLTSIYS
jgi:hypothetical protein